MRCHLKPTVFTEWYRQKQSDSWSGTGNEHRRKSGFGNFGNLGCVTDSSSSTKVDGFDLAGGYERKGIKLDEYCKVVVIGTGREINMRFGFVPRSGEFLDLQGEIHQVDSVKHVFVAGSKSEVVINVFPPESE